MALVSKLIKLGYRSRVCFNAVSAIGRLDSPANFYRSVGSNAFDNRLDDRANSRDTFAKAYGAMMEAVIANIHSEMKSLLDKRLKERGIDSEALNSVSADIFREALQNVSKQFKSGAQMDKIWMAAGADILKTRPGVQSYVHENRITQLQSNIDKFLHNFAEMCAEADSYQNQKLEFKEHFLWLQGEVIKNQNEFQNLCSEIRDIASKRNLLPDTLLLTGDTTQRDTRVLKCVEQFDQDIRLLEKDIAKRRKIIMFLLGFVAGLPVCLVQKLFEI